MEKETELGGGGDRKPRDEWTGGRDEKIERASVTQEEKVCEGVEEVITVLPEGQDMIRDE